MNRIHSIICTFRVPQRTSLSSPQHPDERPLTSDSHPNHAFDHEVDLEEPCWELMDAHFLRLENLQGLQFNLESVHPDFRGKEKLWVQTIASRMPLLRARENFRLTYMISTLR